MNTTFGGFLLFEQVEGNVTQHSQIFRSLVFSDTTAIFLQGDIQYSMQLVFDGPVCANRMENSFCIAGQTGDVVMYFPGDLVSEKVRANDHGNTFQSDPVVQVTDQA